jgi:acid phosphatase family membrane protein YuiD
VNALAQGRERNGDVGGAIWEHPLKENIGHTRLQVLVGSLIGPLVALLGLALVGSPLHLVGLLSRVLSPVG